MAFDRVLTPESASFAGGWLDFLTPWHSRTPRNASWTDFRLRDRRDRRRWGNRIGRLAQRSRGRHAERATSARGQRVSGPLATFALLRGARAPKKEALTAGTRLVWRADAPGEAGTARPVPHRVVPGSQPTQCSTLGLARGSHPFEPATGGKFSPGPPSRGRRAVSGKLSTTMARAPPSGRKVLWLSKACHPSMSPPPSKRVTVIRRHILDPRGRK